MKTLMEMWRDDYFQDCGFRYKNHVNKFVDFLKSSDKSDSPYLINLDDIDKSIEYYSKQGNIKTRASMESHLESIKSFYDYLLEKGKSKDIFTQINYENFKNQLVFKHSLSEKVVRKGFDIEIIKKILIALDDYLSVDYFTLETYREKERYRQRILLRLFIKITLIAPAKRQVICNIKFGDFFNNFKNLRINNVDIRVPNGLTRDIFHAISNSQARGQGKYTLNNKLFEYVFIDNFSDEYLNAWFYYLLKEFDIIEMPDNKTSYAIEPVMITAIEYMVQRMANPALIAKINGSKIGSIEDKYYKNGITEIKIEMSIDDAINWEIAKSEYYNYI